MKLINSNKKCLLFKDGSFYIRHNNIIEAWADVSCGWGDAVSIDNIPPTQSLPDALEDSFLRVRADPWIPSQDFVRIFCKNCINTTIYSGKIDMPIARGPRGMLVCPCCQSPWLYYNYAEIK